MSNNMLLLLKTKPLEDAFDAALVYPNAPAPAVVGNNVVIIQQDGNGGNNTTGR